MDAIFLRPQPGHAIVRILSTVLLAAPLAVFVIFGWQMALRHLKAPQRPPAVAALMKPAVAVHRVALQRPIPTLPVPAGTFAPLRAKSLQRATPEDMAPVSRMRTVAGLRYDADAFLADDGSRFELQGMAMPDRNAQCRRLDGVTVSCAERIATRVDILARTRPIECQLTQRGARITGQCHAGKTDLAEDLLRNGLAHRAAPTREAHL